MIDWGMGGVLCEVRGCLLAAKKERGRVRKKKEEETVLGNGRCCVCGRVGRKGKAGNRKKIGKWGFVYEALRNGQCCVWASSLNGRVTAERKRVRGR